jgi:hypothetical protein
MNNIGFWDPAATHTRQHKDAGVFVPEGPVDSSQAIHCLGWIRDKIRPVGYGMIGWREGGYCLR